MVEARIHNDGTGLLVKTRDPDRFYLLLNQIALNGVGIESVAPADDDVELGLRIPDRVGGDAADEDTLAHADRCAVIRLEMRKTFFARRGLWIYLLALMPLS